MQVDAPCALIGKIDAAEFLEATAQKAATLFRRQQFPGGVDGPRIMGVDVDAAVALDVEHTADIQYVESRAVAEGNRARSIAETHRVVQELELQPLVATPRPGEKDIRHAGVSFNRMRQRVVHRFVAADLQSALPRPL